MYIRHSFLDIAINRMPKEFSIASDEEMVSILIILF